MDKINLTEEEILGISTYTEEISNNPITEGVFIVSYRDAETNKDIIELVTIWNHSLAYRERGCDGSALIKAAEDRVALDASIEQHNKLFEGKRLKFISQDAGLYTYPLMDNREVLVARTLVSGEILFDRYGDILELTERLKSNVPSYCNSLNIENINSIKSDSDSRQYVKNEKK